MINELMVCQLAEPFNKGANKNQEKKLMAG